MTPEMTDLRLALLAWYDLNARDLPWRVLPQAYDLGVRPDPYHVWLSEIMLQQTTIAAVKPYFQRFLAAFPTVTVLAQAPLDEVLSRWAGLGYYARGRNLHKCAQAILGAGDFPQTPAGLSLLPGIGPYTSAAIAAIAFQYPSVPVDGNVERVLSRLWHIEAALPAGKQAFRNAARRLEDDHRPGDFAQALMDLGSTICTPRNPKCDVCPWSGGCLANAAGDAETYPRKAPKKVRPLRYGVCWVHINDAGILVRRRPAQGLLGAMLEVPGTKWCDSMPTDTTPPDALAAVPAKWVKGASVRHIFTHFDLRLEIYAAIEHGTDNAWRIALTDLEKVALPSVMHKVITSGTTALKVDVS